MKRETTIWSIQDLEKRFIAVNFPEYQREPNIWSRGEKRRLIDSILREFDIASLYFYKNTDGSLDCIDGRQRINAIMSFLNENPGDSEDNGFSFKSTNEVYEDQENQFRSLDGLTYEDIRSRADQDDATAKTAIDMLLKYELTAVLLSQTARAEEFNLQFIRLNLGALINAGEKLNAMVGKMRELCFTDEKIGRHKFLAMIGIPTRRYAKEQVAAQIVAQVFSKATEKQFTRTRHCDLQKFFKENAEIDDSRLQQVDEIARTFDVLADVLPNAAELLRNRAMTISAVLVAWERQIHKQPSEEVKRYADFLATFRGRLRWQLAKGLDVDDEYRYLVDFQRHLTQASVEKYAVEARHKAILEQLDKWSSTGELRGDAEFSKRTNLDPE